MIDQIIDYNRSFVAQKNYKQYITDKYPDKKLAVLTCMDTRLTELLPAALGLKNGDAKIIKNAGGLIITPFDSAMRSLIVAIYELGVEEIMVVAHSQCGACHMSYAHFHHVMKARGIKDETLDTIRECGIDLNHWLEGFRDTETSVRKTVKTIQTHPLIPKDVTVRGFIIDSVTGELQEINNYMKIILTGATGYVGEGVMLELLRTPQVEKVLSVGRRPVRIDDYPLSESEKAKLEEYIIPDFMDLKAGDKHFEGYDAVYFIAGITSIGTPENVYRRISYDIPTHFADIMPDKAQMTYIYLSGAGTDPNGKQWWMPIKGATEEYIRTLGFKHAFAYRPALMRWAKGQRGTKMQKMQYAYICFYPLMRLCGLANNMAEVTHSMLACTRDGYPHYAINPRDITKLAKQL